MKGRRQHSALIIVGGTASLVLLLAYAGVRPSSPLFGGTGQAAESFDDDDPCTGERGIMGRIVQRPMRVRVRPWCKTGWYQAPHPGQKYGKPPDWRSLGGLDAEYVVDERWYVLPFYTEPERRLAVGFTNWSDEPTYVDFY